MPAPSLPIPVEQRFVLSNVDWSTYVVFSDKLGERNIRLNYDGRNMEFMTLSPDHEWSKKILGRLVEALTEELDIDIKSGGSMTCRREDLERGLEPDESYWIASEPRVRGRMAIDLRADPPPDLFLEIEISRSFLDRLGICAKLRIPEVWRWDGQTVRVCLLGPDGHYVESDRSKAFPFLPMAELARFVHLGLTMSETKLLRTFRAWVREQVANGWQKGTPPEA